MSKKEMPKYVVRGAKLKCTGNPSTNAYFYPTHNRGTSVGTGLQGIASDTAPENVVGNFGNCSFIDGEDKTCVKDFENFWKDTADAYYSSLTSVEPYYDSLYSSFRKAMVKAGREPAVKSNINANPDRKSVV